MFRLRRGCAAGVLYGGDELALSAAVEVDVRRVAELARSGDTGAELEEILRSGELLPDWYDDWVLAERERFHELRVQVLEELSERHLRSGDVGRALAAALDAVQADPLRESSRRTLIRAHLADGNHHDADMHARQFTSLLARYGLAPSAQFHTLTRAIARPLTRR